MSQHIYNIPQSNTTVTLGYDRTSDYVFCTVEQDDEIIYSNLDDLDAGTEQQDVDYFRKVLIDLDISVPEIMFTEVQNDQHQRVGNRIVYHE